jgi:hypothetical protein
MRFKIKPDGIRVVALIRAVRNRWDLLPGDKIKLPGERPAKYLGSVEEGDGQPEYIQMHAFRLHDGMLVILEVPALNRQLGRLLY